MATTFHSPATAPKTIYVDQMKNAQNLPVSDVGRVHDLGHGQLHSHACS